MSHMKEIEKHFQKSCLDNRCENGTQSIAYFSLEYGIHETVRIYSGGLGALAGDYLKAASDTGVYALNSAIDQNQQLQIQLW